MNPEEPLQPDKQNQTGETSQQASPPREKQDPNVKSVHLHIHVSEMTPRVIREILINLALDWESTVKQIEHLEKEITSWQKRRESIQGVPGSAEDERMLADIAAKINELKQNLNGLLQHQAQLEKEIREVQQSDTFGISGQGREGFALEGDNPERRRRMVKDNLETMLGKGIDEILLEDKIEKEKKEKQVDEDLKRLKEQMKKPE